MGYITPNWLPIAAVQLLAGKWKDRKLHAAAHEALADACRETLGWGVFPTRGLASLTGFKRSEHICKLWDQHLAGSKRDQVEGKLVPEYCRREGIFLNADETLLEYFGRCKDQEMVTVQADQAEQLQTENTLLHARVLELQQELEALDSPTESVKRRRTSQDSGLDGVPSEMDLDNVTLRETKNAFPLWKRWIAVVAYLELGSYVKVVKSFMFGHAWYFGCEMSLADVKRMIPSRASIGRWVLQLGQVMKEREATAAAKAATEHGASGNSDDSTKLGAGGKKVHVVQVNTIREVTDCNSKNFGKLRPVMNTTGYRIPIDGKATTLSNCNQEVLDDYGINMQCFGQWTTDHCNAALDEHAQMAIEAPNLRHTDIPSCYGMYSGSTMV